MKVQRQIEWGDCDAAGIVFYPNFFKWMDATFHEWTRAMGFDQLSLHKEYNIFGTPLIETGCNFILPGRYYENLTISPNLARLGTSSFSLEYMFSIDGRDIASGREVRAFVAKDSEKLSKVPIPKEIRKILEKQFA
ncbi:MAG: thioesterase family protein [Pseudomonadota bacterium]